MTQPVTFGAIFPVSTLDNSPHKWLIDQIISDEYTAPQLLCEFLVADLKRAFGDDFDLLKTPFLAAGEDHSILLVRSLNSLGMDVKGGVVATMTQYNIREIAGVYGSGANTVDEWAIFDQVKDAITFGHTLRVVIMRSPEDFKKLDFRIGYQISQKDYAEMIVTHHVDGTELPPPEYVAPEMEAPQLKDVPLTTRANRILVRNVIALNINALKASYLENTHDLSFEEWMEKVQCIHYSALKDLEKIDALPDDQYIEAIVAFKKGEAQAIHSQEVKAGRTDEHLFPWTLRVFGQEFNTLGRAEAEADILGIAQNAAGEQIPEGNEPALFVSSFDGCLVEDQDGIIGPVTPYAIEVLIELQSQGHCIVIWHHRGKPGDVAYNEMIDMLEAHGFTPNATVEKMGPKYLGFSDIQIHLEHPEFHWEANDPFEVTYVFDQRAYGATTIDISGRIGNNPTLYWGDYLSELEGAGYLTSEKVEELLTSLLEDDVHNQDEPDLN